MVDAYVGPSELHLKKELSQLGKSRLFRDPDTLRAWKSLPVSDSSGANLKLNHVKDKLENIQAKISTKSSASINTNYANEYSKNNEDVNDNNLSKVSLESQSGIEKRNKVHLCNWGHHSSKSSDSGFQLDDDRKQPAVDEIPEGTKSIHTEIRGVKTARKASKGIPLGKRNKKTVAAKRNNIQISDDSGYSESEKSKNNFVQRMTSHSQCISPTFLDHNKISRRTKRLSSSFSCTPTSNRSHDRASGSLDGSDLGVSCEFSKKLKDTFSRSFSSLSLSDTPRSTVRRIICGGRTVQSKRSKIDPQKFKYVPKTSPIAPLLGNSLDDFGPFEDSATDDMVSNFSELDLESISRLDAQRWSNCLVDEVFEPHLLEDKSLCQKYRPKSFDEIVGQDIVVQSLSSAIQKDRVAPAYLFQGPHGTGKTSTACVFAAALNCLSTEESKPCWSCKECNSFAIQKGRYMKEVDANNKKDVGKMKHLLKKLSASRAFSKYKIFVIDECHGLSFNSWTSLMKFVEQPIPRVVFVFITTESESLPRVVVSRCQKFLFSKIKDADIVSMLTFIICEEDLDVEQDALELIASNSKGSLRDAVTMLDQLSLLGKRITIWLVNDLLGVVSEDELLQLLEVALSSNTAETVKMSRELMETGVDPVAIMSQLAGLVMDIISGTYTSTKSPILPLTETTINRLHRSLKILSDAEKQIRSSGEQSTWFTAALLQLGSIHSSHPTPSCSSSRSIKRLVDNTRFWESSSSPILGITSARNSVSTRKDEGIFSKYVSPDKLDAIWRSCVESIDSEILRDLLNEHGKLVSITENKGILIAYIAFEDINLKYRADRFVRHITSSLARVLMHKVEIRIGILSENFPNARKSTSDTMSNRHTRLVEYLNGEGKSQRFVINTSSDIKSRLSVDEKRLEGAWLRAAETGEASISKGLNRGNRKDCTLKHRKDEDSDEIQEVESSASRRHLKQKPQYDLSPSLLHSVSYRANLRQDNLGYESGPVQSGGFCCWRKHSKAKKSSNVWSLKAGNR